MRFRSLTGAVVLAVATFEIGSTSASSNEPDPLPLSSPIVQSLFVATTRSGKTLPAEQLKPLVLHQRWAPTVYTRSRWHLKIGVFLLAVRSDGTVASVEKLQSTGNRELDFGLTHAFMKWQFRPNSVSEVRVPAVYTENWF